MGLQQCPHVKYFGGNRKYRLRNMFSVKSNTMLPCLPSHVFNAAWSSKDGVDVTNILRVTNIWATHPKSNKFLHFFTSIMYIQSQ